MNFILVIVAVVIGVWIYNLMRDFFGELKSSRKHKQLLRWKSECEKNISIGRDVEKNKNLLKTTEELLGELYRKANNKE